MTRRAVTVGDVRIGGGAPIVVQSMTNTDTRDVAATVAQIALLERAGCEIVRVAVPDRAAGEALKEIVGRAPVPLVADIHFNHRLALQAIEAGVAKLRLNPGNLTDRRKIAEVVRAAGEAGIPIRVGANSGSLARRFRDAHGRPTAEGLVSSALEEVRLLEELGFDQIVISVKGTDVPMTVAAYRDVAQKVDYPLHIGITEAGTAREGAIRSSVGLGILLAEGLGDTLRVSLAADPVEEVRVAYEILRALGLRERGICYRVCPTCGRTEVDLVRIAREVEEALVDVIQPLTVALMGCVVNGLGEAGEADVALVGGPHSGTVYVDGEPVDRAVPEAGLAEAVIRAVRAKVGSHDG